MTNLDKYASTFAKVFEIDPSQAATLAYQSIKAWDSVGHMSLIATLEAEFGIQFETEDIIDFSSFEQGKKLLAKYKVVI